MVRSIAAVVVTYIVMSIIIMAIFSALMFGLGPDRLLVPGQWKGNLFLTIAAPTITVVAGLFGGWLCVKIARKRRPVWALAGVVLVLGSMVAYFTMQKPAPTGERPAGMTMEQFLEKGREPTWLLIFNPIGGALAVLVGGMLSRPNMKTKAEVSGVV
jgi:hypothetical protein